ncbi:MAG: prephenate/arogenate dehydrogenase family protein [Hyphomicrobiaceae bacterium]
MFQNVAVAGLGLVGSSLLHAMRRGGLAGKTVGVDSDKSVRTRAEELKLADEIASPTAACASGADLVILAVPLGAMKDVAATLAPGLAAGTIVTDVGSSKRSVIRDMAEVLPDGVHFVPGHPIAGTEQSGPDAGFAELFDGRWCVLTPDDTTDKEALARVKAFWQAIGCDIEIMTADHHDVVLAITSHLPHLIAYNIVGTAADLEDITSSEVIKFSAGGFRDFTRLAASDPVMWRDVCLNNKDAILEMLARFSEDLSALQRAVRWDDGAALFDLFTRTRAVRRRIVDAGQETADPDFGRQATAPGPASKT